MAQVKRKRDGGTYIKYYDSDIQEAKSTNVIDFLEKEYGWSFRQAGSFYQCREHDSLMIKSNCKDWFWNSQGLQGRNAIDWLLKVERYTFTESLSKLVPMPSCNSYEYENYSQKSYSKAPDCSDLPIDEIKQIELPEKLDGAFVRSAAYLTKTRGIDRAIVDFAMKNKLIYEDKNHNVVFVGYDENNEIKFAEAKLTNTFMAAAVDENGKKKFHPKNVKGSDKRYSFNIPADTEKYPNSAGILYVFEAPVDLLSHCTLTLMNERIRAKHEGNKPNLSCWQNVNRLSLSGCSVVALESYLERNPQIHKIVFALDYDNAGIKAAQSMEERFSEKGYSCSKIRPAKGKDFNEYLQITLLEREKQNTNQNNQDTIGVDRSERSDRPEIAADTVRYIQHSVKR